MSARGGWIGVDLDGTLAHYVAWVDHRSIGDPVPRMKARVEEWLADGIDVRIFTARVSDQNPEVVAAIDEWSMKHFGRTLPVTNVKDFRLVELWDDRAVAVEKNTGRAVRFDDETGRVQVIV